MTIKFKKFNRKELPFNNEMLSFWNKNGFLVIDQFYSILECFRSFRIVLESAPQRMRAPKAEKSEDNQHDDIQDNVTSS